jgi:hypothetical protein
MKRLLLLLALLALLLGCGVRWHLTHADVTVTIDKRDGALASAKPLPSSAPDISGKPTPTFPPTAPHDPALAARGAINQILQLPSPDHATTAGRLAPLVLDTEFPAEQRAEALSHLLNLSAGHEAEVLLPLVRDPRLSEEDCRTILNDALNQSADWQGEVYLAALGARTEPKLHARIREHLAFLTGGADLGDDPKAWFEPLVQAATARSNH